MAEYTNFGFIRPEVQDGGPIKDFFKSLFRPRRGLVGDLPVTRFAKKKVVPKPKIVKSEAPIQAASEQEPPKLFEEEVGRFKKYMEHPSYKERLGRELFGDGKVDERAVEEEYQRRMGKLSQIQIMDESGLNKGEEGHYLPSQGILRAKNPEVFYHEMTHALDNNPSIFGVAPVVPFTKVKDRLVTYPIQREKEYMEKYGQYRKPNYKILQEKMAKDVDEGIISPPSYLSKEEYKRHLLQGDPFFEVRKPKPEQGITQEYINAFRANPAAQFIEKALDAEDKEYKSAALNYLKDDTEMKARINSLRLQAIDKYKYDPGKPFNINDYPELKKDHQYKHLTDDLKMSDEDINELSKYIARVPSSNYLQQTPQRQAQYQALQRMA
jgi:hypothetical protein